MKKYPSTESLKNLSHQVRQKANFVGLDENNDPIFKEAIQPIIEFVGTIKLHGSNGGIIFTNQHNNNGEVIGQTISFQSRNRVLSLTSDNAGFMTAYYGKDLSKLLEGITFNRFCAIYGEWCGENIQKGVAVEKLSKRFVIFAVCVDDVWLDDYQNDDVENNIYNINKFKKFNLTIDFNKPEEIQEELERMVLEVEKECPFAATFGVSGIGEGIVWSSKGREFVFKAKGLQHSVSSHCGIGSASIPHQDFTDFIAGVVTKARVEQGKQYLIEMGQESTPKNTGAFLSWIVGDILKEEIITIQENGYNIEHLKKQISNIARSWYLKS